jgi:hypothetical protein
MRLSWIPTAAGVAMGLTISGQAFAQARVNPQTPQYDQAPQYETPKYVPATRPMLDKNFGLPTFGMQGAELPQQRTQAPVPVPVEPTDVFKRPPDYVLPRAGEWRPGGTAMETPLYTTTDGSVAAYTTQPETDGIGTQPTLGRRMETGGFETDTPIRR